MSTQQQTREANLLYIKKFNQQHRHNARLICVATLFLLLLFALWDLSSLGLHHPQVYPLLFIRFTVSLPMCLFVFIYSYQPTLTLRLDRLIAALCLITSVTIISMHYIYLELGTLLTLDSIILCLVAIYFLPNIFYTQKLFIGAAILFSYYMLLIIEKQSIGQFIHSGIYIISINIAGLIHSHSFDKQRRDNFEHHQFLKAMANTDQLTGVGNRHKFDEQFSELLEQAKKENKGIAIAIADIDFFKQYNDHYGHLAGDECLIQVAQALLTMKRHPLDSCIRFGGEEFILIKYDITSNTCLAWGEKIKNTIYKLHIPHAHSSIDNRITISAGVIHWHPTSAFTRTQLMKLADDALYKAKASGRNKVEVHFSQVD